MPAFNKFNGWISYVANGLVDQSATSQFNVYLSNTAPSASLDEFKADLAEIATGNGYSGPVDTQNTYDATAGLVTIGGTKVSIVASGGAIAAFRYVVLYFVSVPFSDPLVGWWDNGSAINLADGETFNIKFNNSNTTGTIFTLS